MKIYYQEYISGKDDKKITKFDNIADFKAFFATNPNPLKFSCLQIEKEGRKEILVMPVYLGDHGYKEYHARDMSQEDSNKYRPYFDRFQVTPAGYSNAEITDVFMLKNIMQSAERKSYDPAVVGNKIKEMRENVKTETPTPKL